MTHLAPKSFIGFLQALSQQKWSGRLEIQSPQGEVWELNWVLGRLVWATGGSHAVARLHRHLVHVCPQIAADPNIPVTSGMRGWDYHFLTVLARWQRISREQVVTIIEGVLREVIFDCLQQEIQGLSFQTDHYSVQADPLTVISVEYLLQPVQQQWEAWRNAGLADRSPNLTPVIQRPDQLKALVSPVVFQSLTTALNGKKTLRDLSLQMQQELLFLTRSLMPYISKGLIGLVPTPNALTPFPGHKPSPAPQASTPPASVIRNPSQAGSPTGLLVACIDDSPTVGKAMESILTQAGYRFLGIQDSLTALPLILSRKPDLIFLDLIMPVANGYEICTQIRRISAFKDIPVVILTGNDGLIDRVRAKMVGASDFISKPVDAERVLGILRRYLHQSASAPSGSSVLEIQGSRSVDAPMMVDSFAKGLA